MKYQVSGPQGQGGFYDDPEVAVRAASQIVAMPSGSKQRHIEALKAGMSAAWAYGFSEVWIYPIRQTDASVTG